MFACKPMKRHAPAQAYVTGAGRGYAAATHWERRKAGAFAAVLGESVGGVTLGNAECLKTNIFIISGCFRATHERACPGASIMRRAQEGSMQWRHIEHAAKPAHPRRFGEERCVACTDMVRNPNASPHRLRTLAGGLWKAILAQAMRRVQERGYVCPATAH